MFASETVNYVTLATLGGIIPAIIWLWFWLREDEHPEPKKLITLALIAGAFIVPFVVPLQKFAFELYSEKSFAIVAVCALVEEIYKYAAALILILWRKDVNEPIDYVIYMIMIAIGFSAFENILYMYRIAVEEGAYHSMLNGSFRFLGASLVHIVSSATVGAFMAFSFGRSRFRELLYGFIGLSTATVLHAYFNFSILKFNGDERTQFVFLGVWVGTVILLLIIERIKRIRYLYTK